MKNKLVVILALTMLPTAAFAGNGHGKKKNKNKHKHKHQHDQVYVDDDYRDGYRDGFVNDDVRDLQQFENLLRDLKWAKRNDARRTQRRVDRRVLASIDSEIFELRRERRMIRQSSYGNHHRLKFKRKQIKRLKRLYSQYDYYAGRTDRRAFKKKKRILKKLIIIAEQNAYDNPRRHRHHKMAYYGRR